MPNRGEVNRMSYGQEALMGSVIENRRRPKLIFMNIGDLLMGKIAREL